MKKGDRVEYTDNKGIMKYGVVRVGGFKKVTVVLDGGDYEVSGLASCFRLSNKPLPVDEPSVMDRYSVVRYKEVEGHGDSATFSAVIVRDGVPLLSVSNDGWGGSNCYSLILRKSSYFKISRGDLEQFYKDIQKWAEQFGCRGMIEPEDIWVEWSALLRPYGVLAVDYLGVFREIRKGAKDEG